MMVLSLMVAVAINLTPVAPPPPKKTTHMTLGGPDVTIFKVRVKSRVRVIKSSTQYQPLNPELDYVEYIELN